MSKVTTASVCKRQSNYSPTRTTLTPLSKVMPKHCRIKSIWHRSRIMALSLIITQITSLIIIIKVIKMNVSKWSLILGRITKTDKYLKNKLSSTASSTTETSASHCDNLRIISTFLDTFSIAINSCKWVTKSLQMVELKSMTTAQQLNPATNKRMITSNLLTVEI